MTDITNLNASSNDDVTKSVLEAVSNIMVDNGSFTKEELELIRESIIKEKGVKSFIYMMAKLDEEVRDKENERRK